MSRNSGKSCSFVFEKGSKNSFFWTLRGAFFEKIIDDQNKLAQNEQKNRDSLLKGSLV